MNTKLKKSRKIDPFGSPAFLDRVGVARKVARFRTAQSIFSQGDAADNVMYIQRGGVQFSAVNASGREAVVALFGPSDFFGEGCMSGQLVRKGTATAILPTTILVIGKKEMLRVVHAEHRLSEHFIRHMIARNIRIEEDLIAQLFDSSEKLLARTLLLLAGYGMLLNVSQGTLAKMIGTTRSRVNVFMNKFTRRGFVEYNGRIKVNKSLLTILLRD